MQEQISETLAQPVAPSSPAVKLWTPRLIGLISFFLGFPAGIVLASINWMRMNMNNKALTYLIGGMAGTFILTVLLIFIPGDIGRLVGLAANLGALLYLYREMEKDLGNFKAAGYRVENANGLGGCLIGLGILVLFLISAFAIGFVLTILGVPIPE